MPKKNTFIRGKWGTQAGIKKAIVFLKKGDTIAIA
jgi:ribosomal protein L23